MGKTSHSRCRSTVDARYMFEMKFERRRQPTRKGVRKYGPSVVLYRILVPEVCMEDQRVAIASNPAKVGGHLDEHLYAEDM